MTKRNFSKVEKSLDIFSQKERIKKIIALTEKEEEAAKEEEEKIKNKYMGNVLRSLQDDLKRLSEKSEMMWEALGISKEDLAQLIENPGKLSKEDRERIGSLMEKIQEYKQSSGKALEDEINQDIVEQMRSSNVDKRINLNKKWKPV